MHVLYAEYIQETDTEVSLRFNYTDDSAHIFADRTHLYKIDHNGEYIDVATGKRIGRFRLNRFDDNGRMWWDFYLNGSETADHVGEQRGAEALLKEELKVAIKLIKGELVVPA